MTEGPRVCLSYLHEKQTSRIQSLYLYFIKIVPFWLQNIRFLIQNTRSLFYGRHYSSLHRLMSLHGKMDVQIFLMLIVAENTRSVNILKYSALIAKRVAYVETTDTFLHAHMNYIYINHPRTWHN